MRQTAACNQGLKSRVLDSIMTGADAETELMPYTLSVDVGTRVLQQSWAALLC